MTTTSIRRCVAATVAVVALGATTSPAFAATKHKAAKHKTTKMAKATKMAATTTTKKP